MSNKEELLHLLEEKERRRKFNKTKYLFPDEGPLRRELYKKHLAFFKAGKEYRQRAFIGANRVGKSFSLSYELGLHLTGDYPEWWEGRKYNKPVEIVVASISNAVTKDLFQKELIGPMDAIGTGMVPLECIDKTFTKAGVAGAISEAWITHKSGGKSKIFFKAYEQGRDTFQGTHPDIIALDEEPKDPEVYSECLTRTMGTAGNDDAGMIMVAFTPLLGMSELVLSFLPNGKFPKDYTHPENPYKFVVNVTWDDVPHLTEEDKEELLLSYSEKEREARSKGIPTLGIYSIYPVLEDEVIVNPFYIPDYFEKCYGIHVDHKKVSILFAAKDPSTGVIYLIDENQKKPESAVIHSAVIKKKCKEFKVDMVGSINKEYLDLYSQEELTLDIPPNNLESDLKYILQLLETGQLKIFSTLEKFLREFRLYRRSEKGKILQDDAGLMEAMRYILTCSIHQAESFDEDNYISNNEYGRNKVTGY